MVRVRRNPIAFMSAFGGIADNGSRAALIASDANDPKRTKAGSKSRSAAVRAILSVGSTGGTGH